MANSFYTPSVKNYAKTSDNTTTGSSGSTGTSTKSGFYTPSTKGYIPSTFTPTTLQKPANSIIPDQSWAKMTPKVQQQLIDTQKSVDQSKADIWNPAVIAGDVGKNIGDFATNLVGGAVKSGVSGLSNAYNDIATGFDKAQTQKNTEDFTKSLGIDKWGTGTSDAAKLGSTIGGFAGGIATFLPDTAEKIATELPKAILSGKLASDANDAYAKGDKTKGDYLLAESQNRGITLNEVGSNTFMGILLAMTGGVGGATSIESGEKMLDYFGTKEGATLINSMGREDAAKMIGYAKEAAAGKGANVVDKIVNTISKYGEGTGAKNVAKNVLVKQGGIGTGFGVGGTIANPNATPQDYLTSALGGYAGGVVVGGAVEGAKKALNINAPKTTEPVVSDHATARTKTEEAIGSKLTDNQAASLAENAPKVENVNATTIKPEVSVKEQVPDLSKSLNKSDYETILKSKIDEVPAPKEGEITVIQSGTSGHVDTQIDEALGRGINENTRVFNVKESELKLTGDETKNLRGERLYDSSNITDNIPETKTSGRALKTEQQAIEEGLTTGIENKAKYNVESYKENKVTAEDLVKNNKQGALDIVEGKTAASGAQIQETYKALVKQAKETKDIDLYERLVRSEHAETKLSEAAQTMGASGYELDPTNPVARVREIKKALEERMSKRTTESKSKVAKSIDGEVSKVLKANENKSWNSFLEGIKC